MKAAFVALLSATLTLVAVLVAVDVHAGALTADGPILRGWLAVILHVFALAVFGCGGLLLGSLSSDSEET